MKARVDRVAASLAAKSGEQVMTQRQPVQRETPTIIGEEELNPQALVAIEERIGSEEIVLAYTGFDWENKVIAVTDQRVIVADGDEEVQFDHVYSDITSVSRQGRTLAIKPKRRRVAEYRMGDEANVAEIEHLINHLISQDLDHTIPSGENHSNSDDMEDLQLPNIAERVKFWEEQDKINQELIPRVIQQHELLTGHIADHENLPLVVGNAISEALAEAREEQRQQHEAEVAELRAEADEQRRQHAAELTAAKAEREEQSRQHSDQVTTLQAQLRQAKTQLMMATGGAVVIAIAGALIGILV